MLPHQGGMAIQEFSDSASISSWALEAVQWAVNAGLISGTGDGMLDPDGLQPALRWRRFL